MLSQDHRRVSAIALLLSVAVISCSGDGEGLNASGDLFGIGFGSQIQPIFDTYCVRCHATGGTGYLGTGGDSENGLDLSPGASHSRLVDQPTFRAPQTPPLWRVRPFEPDDSYLLQKIISEQPKFGSRMPGDGPPFLSAAEIDLVRDWIEAGALHN